MTTQVHLDAEPKSSFDLLASVPAGKGLGMLPEESKQDVPYAQGVFRLLVGGRDREWGRSERKRKRKISQFLCYEQGSLDLLRFIKTRQGGRLT